MPRDQLSPKYSGKIKGLAIFLVIFLFFLGILFYIQAYFRIREIRVNYRNGKFSVIGLEDLKGENILFLNSRSTMHLLKEKNPELKTVVIGKDLPDKITLSLETYRGIARFAVSNGYFILSEDGRILSKGKSIDNGLTLINYYQKLDYYSYSAGDFLDTTDIKSALEFIIFLRGIGLEVDSLDIGDKDMLLFNVGSKKIIFTAEKDRKIQEYQVREIVRQFKIEGKDYKQIDLRFDRPVVGF